MENNPYSSARFEQARQHIGLIIKSMEQGDLEAFGNIVEKEALTLHALMMSSTPPYMLMEPGSLKIIKEIQAFRESNKVPVYFTLDAGPNIHMLYPDSFKNEVKQLKEELITYCHKGIILEDTVGNGPEKL